MLVTVVDGDTHKRLRGARVVIGKTADYANTRGLAAVRIRHRTALEVRISKPGYATRTVRMPFKQRRQVTARLYRNALQWTMFGANAQRTSTHAEISIKPPFKVVWSRGPRLADRVPRGRLRGRRLHRELQGDDLRVSTADRQGRLALRPARREDGLLAGGRRTTTSSCTGWTESCACSTGATAGSAGVPSRLADRVVAGGRGRDRLLRRLERAGLRARPEAAKLRWRQSIGAKITSSAALAGKTLYIGDYAGRLHRLSTTSGRSGSRARSTGAIYGTPAVAAAASSSPRRPAAA